MLQRFRRITSGSSWIPQIDGLRFMAIASVLLTHTYGQVSQRGPRFFGLPPGTHWYTDAIGYGGRGVYLFFAISGYILCRPFLRQHLLQGHKVTLGQYFMRRVTRLEPPYILSLLIYAGAALVGRNVAAKSVLLHTLASMAYLNNLVYHGANAVNFVTWSLEIEIQFYLLAPLLGCVFMIRNTPVRRMVLVLMILLATFVSQHSGPHAPIWIGNLMHYFLIGFLLADLLEYPRHAPRQFWAWDIVSLAAWPLIFLFPDSLSTWPYALLLLILMAYLAAFYGKASNWFFRQPVIALTGGMCYSIYLMHMLVIESAFRAVKHVQFASAGATVICEMALLSVPILIVSATYFLLVERPCMDPAWPQKLWLKLRPATAPEIHTST